MPAPESILSKVKLLLNLANSPNPNEAENARGMADKLIAKYEITPEELESLKDKPSPYAEDNKLFTTIGLSSWKQQLALSIGTHFYCKIVQEKLVPGQGIEQYNYYVFGESDDIQNVKFVFPAFIKKVEELVRTKSLGRGPVFVTSYCEGVAEAISNNIHWNGIDLPGIKEPVRSTEAEKDSESQQITTVPKEKTAPETPTAESVNVTSQREMIKDIGAYFKGLEDGKNLSFNDILELEQENEGPKQLS